MAEIWFSSDHHFYHENIISYCKRPFHTVDEMNEFMVQEHNKVVKPSDHWYCLGDICMGRDNQGRELWIIDKMHGHKRLILGNHDHYAMKHYLLHFEKVMAMQMIDRMRFTHIPIHPSSVGSIHANVHGHIHNNQGDAFPPVRVMDMEHGMPRWVPYVNLSVEVINYRPVTLGEVKDMVRKALLP